MKEDEMVGWHHRLNGHEFEQTRDIVMDREAWRGCSSWSCKVSDTTECLNNNNNQTGGANLWPRSWGPLD